MAPCCNDKPALLLSRSSQHFQTTPIKGCFAAADLLKPCLLLQFNVRQFNCSMTAYSHKTTQTATEQHHRQHLATRRQHHLKEGCCLATMHSCLTDLPLHLLPPPPDMPASQQQGLLTRLLACRNPSCAAAAAHAVCAADTKIHCKASTNSQQCCCTSCTTEETVPLAA